jgi:hypothetical protein
VPPHAEEVAAAERVAEKDTKSRVAHD